MHNSHSIAKLILFNPPENPLFTVVATDPSEPSLPPVQLLSEQSNDSTKDTAGCEAVIEPTTKRRNGQEATLAAEKSVLAISPAPLPMPPASKSQLVQGEVMDTGRIIGAVTAQIVHVDECEDVNLYTDDSHTHIMWVVCCCNTKACSLFFSLVSPLGIFLLSVSTKLIGGVAYHLNYCSSAKITWTISTGRNREKRIFKQGVLIHTFRAVTENVICITDSVFSGERL